jgi:hypothetical protein
MAQQAVFQNSILAVQDRRVIRVLKQLRAYYVLSYFNANSKPFTLILYVFHSYGQSTIMLYAFSGNIS